MARRRCKYGKLKHKIGKRVCKLRSSKRPSTRRRTPPALRRARSREAVKYERDVERDLIARMKSRLGRYRRRKR